MSKVFIPFNKKVKKIKLTIYSKNKIENGLAGEGHQPWTFIDEIQVVK